MRLECGCPGEYPDWRDCDVDLGGWLVHTQKIPMFLHMPIGYEAYLHRQHEDIERLQLSERWPGFVLTESSAFKGRILAPLNEERSPARNTSILPHPFHVRARIFQGDVQDVRKEVSAMQTSLLDEGKMPKALYLSYLTCPKCEEARGGKKMMILRNWIPSKKLAAKLEKQKKA